MLTGVLPGSGASDIEYSRAQETNADGAFSRGEQRHANDDQHLRSCEATSLTRQEVKSAQVYDAQTALNRGDEENIYRHYQRQGYWQDRNGREAA